MRYICLLMSVVVCFTWITVTIIQQNRVYRVEHDKLFIELLLKSPKSLPSHPDGIKVPGGIEIKPGMKRV